MARFFSFLFKYIFLPVILLLLVFYYWASSSGKTKDYYIKVEDFSDVKGAIRKDTFSIITYNIGYLSGMTNNQATEPEEGLFSTNLRKSIQLFKKYEPDFVAFQEIDFNSKRSFNVNQLEEICEAGSFKYAAYAVNWDKNYVPFPYWPPSVHFGRILSGQAVASTFPFVQNKRLVLQKPEEEPFYYNAFYLERLLQITQVDVGRPLIIMNVHLEAFHKGTRQKQMDYVVEVLKDYLYNYPVILAGDFNSRPPFAAQTDPEDKTIEKILSIPTIAMAIPDSVYMKNESDFFTFSSGEPVEKIDYIFYNADKIEAIEGDVLKEAEQISDHLPVYFKFTFRK